MAHENELSGLGLRSPTEPNQFSDFLLLGPSEAHDFPPIAS